MDCLFCKICRGEIPAKIVYEDDRILAFEDINPQAPTHVQIIPRKHIASTLEISEEDHEILGAILRTGADLARKFGFDEDGFRLVVNTGPAAGQSVYHIHVHLLGGRSLSWPPG